MTITPYITVHNGKEAIDFYKSAFGAEVTGDLYMEPDGRVGHADLSIAGAPFMLSDEYPDYQAISPKTLGNTTFALHLRVPDADAAFDRAVKAGVKVLRGLEDQPYGRMATVEDPFGHRWFINGPVKG